MALAATLLLASCASDDDNTETLRLTVDGLENLGPDYAYEGWIMVDGSPVTAGIFTINDEGVASQTSFDINADDLASATAYILTIEPSPDADPAPSDVHVLAGDFAGSSAGLTTSHGAAIGSDFMAAAGSFILATPTDDDASNEASGVWFIDPMAGPGAGLLLPTLPAGWVYEGWAVIDGQPLSTGTFTNVEGRDSAAPYSGNLPGPAFPGEDFLLNAPASLSFPADLSNSTIVVSVEPVPDNSSAPFALKPLVVSLSGAEVHSSITMTNNAAASNPSGTVGR